MSPEGLPFRIEELSPLTQHDQLMAIHRHSYYLLGVCLEGETSHMLDFEQVTASAGELMLVIPGQVHLPLKNETGRGYVVAFTADFLLPRQIEMPRYAVKPVGLPDGDLKQVRQIFVQLQREYTERPPQYVAMLQHYLALLITILQRYAAPNAHAGPPLLSGYLELLANHFLEWTKPAQYASALHISPDHLNDVVKQHTGQTLSAHINQRRILEAKRLLLHAKESIKEIAWHLQFNEVSYFNRFFKQHTGSTPASFREKAREKYPSTRE
jgi:AraC-like DNA-binding protein